jgi:arginyl-tRNA synthetase
MTILSEENEVKRNIRIILADLTGKTIQHATSLLGIVSPNRM